MKEKWIKCLAVAAALLLVAISFVSIPLFIRQVFGTQAYQVNKVSGEEDLPVAENFYLYSGEDLGFSFQYPMNRTTGWSKEDGAFIYCGEDTQPPYVLVYKTNQYGMTPQRYFDNCNKQMLKTFGSVQSTPITQATVGEKTLYLTRYVCDGLVIDRYIELYDTCYIQYTAIAKEEGALDTELYYAITTLSVKDGAYTSAYSEKTTRRSHDGVGLSLEVPNMLETKDLTIGYFASNKDAVLLAVLITQDDAGEAIYNRQDYIDRAAASPAFVAGLLGAEDATFTQGQEMTLGGKSFYAYPMEMTGDGAAYSGELYLANAGETGCWMLCAAARENGSAYEDVRDLLTKCVKNVKFE